MVHYTEHAGLEIPIDLCLALRTLKPEMLVLFYTGAYERKGGSRPPCVIRIFEQKIITAMDILESQLNLFSLTVCRLEQYIYPYTHIYIYITYIHIHIYIIYHTKSKLVERYVKSEFCVVIRGRGGGGGQGGGQGTRICHLVSRNVKAEFCVVIGVGGSKGARISHIVSRDIKAEFCVGEVGGDCEYHT